MIRNTRELVMGEPHFLLQVALVGLALPTIYTTSVLLWRRTKVVFLFKWPHYRPSLPLRHLPCEP